MKCDRPTIDKASQWQPLDFSTRFSTSDIPRRLLAPVKHAVSSQLLEEPHRVGKGVKKCPRPKKKGSKK